MRDKHEHRIIRQQEMEIISTPKIHHDYAKQVNYLMPQ